MAIATRVTSASAAAATTAFPDIARTALVALGRGRPAPATALDALGVAPESGEGHNSDDDDDAISESKGATQTPQTAATATHGRLSLSLSHSHMLPHPATAQAARCRTDAALIEVGTLDWSNRDEIMSHYARTALSMVGRLPAAALSPLNGHCRLMHGLLANQVS